MFCGKHKGYEVNTPKDIWVQRKFFVGTAAPTAFMLTKPLCYLLRWVEISFIFEFELQEEL